MSMDAIVKTVSQVAPLLGGALGGPAGAAIGSIIASKFGGSTDNTQDLLSKIQLDPQAREKLLEIQSNNQLELERIKMTMVTNKLDNEIKSQEIEFKDRDSARSREVKLAEAGVKDRTTSILSYIILFLISVTVMLLFFKTVPDDNQVMMASALSALTSMGAASIAYYFGSIKSKENDKK